MCILEPIYVSVCAYCLYIYDRAYINTPKNISMSSCYHRNTNTIVGTIMTLRKICSLNISISISIHNVTQFTE